MFVEVLQYHIEAIVNKHLTKLTVTEYLLFTVYMFVWLFTVYCAHVCLVIYCLLCTCLFGYLLFTVHMFVWCFVCAGQGLKWW